MVARGTISAWNTGLLLFLASLCYKGNCDELNGSGCGRLEGRGRIVGGKNAKKLDLPWTVNIHASFASDGGRVEKYRCAGSIISPRFVLTAARCVLKNRDELASIVKVYYKDEQIGKGPSIRVADTQIHPSFDRKTRLHNIAVLRLMNPIPIGKFARPVCLLSKKMMLMRKTATVSGWGNGQRLKRKNVKIIPFKVCMARLPEVRIREVYRNNTLVCTSGIHGGPCRSDGGGPVTIVGSDNRVTQVGVVSFPYSCSKEKTMPSAHTRVDNYYAWIQSVIDYYKKWNNKKLDNKKGATG